MNRLKKLVELQKLDREIDQVLNGDFDQRDDFGALDKINKMRQSRTTISKKIDAVVFKRYERLRGNKKDTLAVVPMLNGVCSGCNITVSTSTRAKLHRHEDVVTCEHCGRFIYIQVS